MLHFTMDYYDPSKNSTKRPDMHILDFWYCRIGAKPSCPGGHGLMTWTARRAPVQMVKTRRRTLSVTVYAGVRVPTFVILDVGQQQRSSPLKSHSLPFSIYPFLLFSPDKLPHGTLKTHARTLVSTRCCTMKIKIMKETMCVCVCVYTGNATCRVVRRRGERRRTAGSRLAQRPSSRNAMLPYYIMYASDRLPLTSSGAARFSGPAPPRPGCPRDARPRRFRAGQLKTIFPHPVTSSDYSVATVCMHRRVLENK